MTNNLYLKPSDSFEKILNQNVHYMTFISYNYTYIIHAKIIAHPHIDKLTITRLAGYQFYTDSEMDIDIITYDHVYVTKLGSDQKILEISSVVSNITWGFDSSYFIYCADGILHIYYLDKTQLKIDLQLNMIDGCPYALSSNNNICILRAKDKSIHNLNCIQPISFENTAGIFIAKRTIPNLLKNKNDQANFIYGTNSSLYLVDINKSISLIKLVDVCPIKSFSLSEMSNWVMYEVYIDLSYITTANNFGYGLHLINLKNHQMDILALIPKSESELEIKDSCKDGPRHFKWIVHLGLDHIMWIRAIDLGNPKTQSTYRDQIMLYNLDLSLNIVTDSVLLAQTKFRCRGVQLDWLDKYWITESSEKEKIIRINRLDGLYSNIFTWDTDDVNADPGQLIFMPNSTQSDRIYVDLNNNVWITQVKNSDASVYTLNLNTGIKKIIWQSNSDAYQKVVKMMKIYDGYISLLYTDENPTQSKIYKLFHVKSPSPKSNSVTYSFIYQSTTVINHRISYPELGSYSKKTISYVRLDGFNLSSTLYLPAGYVGGFLPILIWAYPIEYVHAKSVGQVRSSKLKFDYVKSISPLYWLTLGYIIVDDCDMPIIRDGGDFITQLKLNAEAIISYLRELKLTDGTQIAICGHSFGAFMVANLLTSTNLFTTGIAMSGAYNRTLTPFGFQFEDQNLWDRLELYVEISPYLSANKIQSPILLIHGQSDSNPGTNPIQSELYYQALRGLGKEAKLLLLPNEGHTYKSIESILHVLYTCEKWLDKFFLRTDIGGR